MLVGWVNIAGVSICVIVLNSTAFQGKGAVAGIQLSHAVKVGMGRGGVGKSTKKGGLYFLHLVNFNGFRSSLTS